MPLDPKLQKYTTASQVVATYDYVDVDEGTGTIHYKGGRVSVDAITGNDVYFLSRNEIVPSETNTLANANVDFDVKFNTPKVITGPAYIVVPLQSTSTITITGKVTIIHVDANGNETIIVAQVTLQAVPTGPKFIDRVLKVTIPRTNFAAGETLRINIDVTRSGEGFARFNHDPLGSNASYTLSGGRFSAYIPFELNF